MAYSKEKQETLFHSLNNVAALVGSKHTKSDGKQIGLNLSLENENCLNTAKTVRDGLFHVIVMGTFSSGKSTFINALIGNKILPESAKACTAVLTYIQYGMNEDKVDVHMKDEVSDDGKTVTPGKVETMSIQSFKEKYQFTVEDEKECLETGTIKRFSNVDYAIMNCKKPLMEGGVRIIDSPGLEDKAVATDMTLDMVQKAQAVIFLTAERGFTRPDRDYITTNFKNAPNNVFFIINKLDNIKKNERGSVLETVKNTLKQVFTQSNGTVDEELMNKRIFGLSALQAIDSRRGYVYDKEEDVDVPINEEECVRLLEKSNFLPFEQELERFLTTDEHCVAQYQSCFHQMAVTYRAALQRVTSELKFYETQDNLSQEKKSECLRIIQQISDQITLLEQKFENGSLKIQNVLSSILNQLSGNIDKTWDADLLNLKDEIVFGMRDYYGIAWSNINPFNSREEKEEKIKEYMKPFVDTIAKYVLNKVEEHLEENRNYFNSAVNEVCKMFGEDFREINDMFNRIGTTIVNEEGGGQNEPSTENIDTLKTILAVLFNDISNAVKTAAGGQTSWIEFVKKIVLNSMWQSLLLAIQPPYGVIIVLLIEYLQSKNNKNAIVEQILTKTKDAAVKSLKDEIISKVLKITKDNVAVIMDDYKNKQSKGMRLKLQDEKNRIAEIESNINNNQFSYQAEKTRCESILHEVFIEAQNAYQVVMERPLTQQDFVIM